VHTLGSVNWFVDCLSEVDRQDLSDRWNFSAPMADPGNAELGRIYLDVLACPGYESAFQQPGGLSYVIPSGFADMNGITGYDTILGGCGSTNGNTNAQLHRDFN